MANPSIATVTEEMIDLLGELLPDLTDLDIVRVVETLDEYIDARIREAFDKRGTEHA